MKITQEELDVLMDITIQLYEHPRFKEKSMDREKAQEWVRERLAKSLGVYSIPCGVSWAILCSSEEYIRGNFL